MLSNSKSYIPKKSRRLALLLEKIQRPVDTTPRKPRRIIQRFEEVLHSPVGYAIQVAKPNEESLLTKWKYDCPAASDVFVKSVKEDIQDIVTYTQQLGMAQEFHSQDVKLLLEALIKHFLWHLEYPFQEKDLELRAYISKVLRKPTLPINQELH